MNEKVIVYKEDVMSSREKENALLAGFPEFANIYFSDLNACPKLARNLLMAVLDNWVKVVRKEDNFVVVEGLWDVIASLYEETPGWLKEEGQA